MELRPRGHLRERLLDAARAVLADDGLEGLTLRAIARRAGVSHGAPLRHFPTLAALLAAVAAEGFAHLVAAVDAALARADAEAAAAGRPLRAVERVAVAGETYIAVALADPGVFAVTFRPERCDVSDPEYQAQGERSFGQLEGLVAAAQAEGWHPDEPSRALAAALWALVHGTADLTIGGGLGHVLGGDMVALRRTTEHLLFGALAPVPAGGHRPPDRPDPTQGGPT